MFDLKFSKYGLFSPIVGRGSETQLQVGENLNKPFDLKGFYKKNQRFKG